MAAVDIVMPVFNPAGFIDEAVASVVAQQHADWRLFLIDDGSTQSLPDYGKLDPRIRMTRQANAGQAAARNHGISLSDAPYIAFLDQDDVWEITKLGRQIDALRAEPLAAFCHTQFALIDEAGAARGRGFGRRQTYGEMLSGSGVCGASTVMVRRDRLFSAGLFDTLFEPAEDYDLWLRLCRRRPVCFVESVEASYRLHGQNQTRKYRDTHHAIRSILRKHYDFAVRAGDEASETAARLGVRRVRATYASQAYDAARKARKEKQWMAALIHLGYAARRCPLLVSRWVVLYLIGSWWRGRRSVTPRLP